MSTSSALASPRATRSTASLTSMASVRATGSVATGPATSRRASSSSGATPWGRPLSSYAKTPRPVLRPRRPVVDQPPLEVGRGVARVAAGLLPHRRADGEVDVLADQVGQLQRTHPEPAGSRRTAVDGGRVGHARLDHPLGLAVERPGHPVDDEARRRGAPDRRLAPGAARARWRALEYASAVCVAADDLDQPHQRRRVEEVQAERPARGGAIPSAMAVMSRHEVLRGEQRRRPAAAGPARRTAPAWRRGPRRWPRSPARSGAGRRPRRRRSAGPVAASASSPADPALVGEPVAGSRRAGPRRRRRRRRPRRRGGRGEPAWAATWAMPAPMAPAPTIATGPVRRVSVGHCDDMSCRCVGSNCKSARYDRSLVHDHRHRCPLHPLTETPPRDPRAGAPGPRRPRSYFSRYPESPSPRVYGEDAARGARPAFEAHLAERLPPGWPASRTDGTVVGDEVSPYGPTLRVRLPAARRRRGAGRRPGGDAGLAGRRRADPRGGLRRDRRPDQRALVRDRQRRHAHQRAAVRDVVPGRWPARPGPRARGGRRPRSSSRSACRRRCVWEKPGRRASRRPDAEGLPDRARAASRWSSAATRSRPGTPTPASSPRWPPATPSSSSRTRAPSCRWRSRVAGRADGARAEAGFDPALVQLAAEADGEGLAKTLAERARGGDHRLHRRPGFGGWLEREAAAATASWSTPRRPGVNSIVVDSTDNLRGVAGQPGLLASRSTPARCARRRRTSTCPATASTPTRGTCPSRSSATRLADARRPAHRRRRQGGRAARRDGQRRGARQRGPPRCRARRGGRRHASCSTPAQVAHPAYPDAVVRAPGLVARRRRARGRLHAGVLRAGGVPHRARTARTQSLRAVRATPCASTAR